MPEMPEVQGLVDFLGERLAGLAITKVTVANIAALKTYDPPVDALKGAVVTGAARHGKFVDLATTGPHLVFHLAKAGWLRWYQPENAPKGPPSRSSKSPVQLRMRWASGACLDLTEAGEGVKAFAAAAEFAERLGAAEE